LWTEGAWNNRSTREKVLKDIIYSTTWDNTRFQVSKPIQDWYSEYDYWFTDQFKTMPAGTNWKGGIEFIEKNIDPSLLSFKKNHETDLIKLNQIPGLESYASPLYHIGSV
jgi:hypothetical protein